MLNGHVSQGRRPASRDAGFSLLELIVSIIVISVLAAVLLSRLGYYQEMAEKAAMESTVRIIKTGLQVQLAEWIVTNRQAEADRLETEDPMQWLDGKPSNYAGAYRFPLDPGTWYYDASQRQLVYVVNSGDRLDFASEAGPKQIRFRARLLKDRLKLNGIVVESVSGVALLPVQPYRWQ